MADQTIDIRGLLCPLTWARVKKALLGMQPGQRLHVVLDHRPAIPDIKRNAADLGHEVDRIEERIGYWELEIELGSPGN